MKNNLNSATLKKQNTYLRNRSLFRKMCYLKFCQKGKITICPIKMKLIDDMMDEQTTDFTKIDIDTIQINDYKLSYKLFF